MDNKNIVKKYSAPILILLGSLSWSLTMVKSGIVYSFGVGFWGANGHDGVWHIALIESLAKGTMNMPVFAGEILKNYHIGFDLLVAIIHKITSIPVVNLYFQIIPPIFALLIGILTYKFVFDWQKDKAKAYWAVFFVYFGGSWAWVFGKGESAFWSQQAISTLINPPFALSLIFILLGLISLLKKKTLLAILFFGPLIQIKAYAAILVLGGLLVSRNFKILLGSLAITILLVFLFGGSSFPFVWQPFWFLETMMGLTDRVGWLKFHSAMTNYRMGGIWLKAIPAYLLAFLIFLAGNLGTRLFAFWKRKIASIDIFMYSVVGAGIAIPMLFLQKGTPWNTIQFFYYSPFFLGILAGISFVEMARHFKLQGTYKIYLVEGALILFTIPAAIFTLRDVYIPSRPPAMISNNELSALAFLKDQPEGVVLTYLFDRVKAKEAEANPPRPLYLYESTAYVSAFSAKQTFLEDEVNLDITGYNWPQRRKEAEEFYSSLDQRSVREFLRKNNIKYVYWLKGQRAKLGETQLGITRIFENKEVDIYEVD